MRSRDNRDTWVEQSRINGSYCITYQAFNFRSEKHIVLGPGVLRLYRQTCDCTTVRQCLQPGYSATSIEKKYHCHAQ
jgi:hypothetical protein